MRRDLFPETLPKRAKPRVLMHVSDAGQVSYGNPRDFGWNLERSTNLSATPIICWTEIFNGKIFSSQHHPL